MRILKYFDALFILGVLFVMLRGQADNFWTCKDGKRSIGEKYVCDGKFHCTDGSDESKEVCSHWNCTELHWKCGSHECIHAHGVCDNDFNGYNDRCRDGSDEDAIMCSTWKCPEGYWKCGSNECIQEDYVCDGDFDHNLQRCNDGSDESYELCSTWQCLEGYWKCVSNECIPTENVCDDNKFYSPPCADGSDEAEILCSTWPCRKGYWRCGSNECIKEWSVCNISPDCIDKSDESHAVCSTWECTVKYWKCGSNECISADLVCDADKIIFYAHCSDGSDEDPTLCFQWNCTANHWKCDDNLQCVNEVYLCDGDYDCNDESDEASELCEDWVCPTGQWRCVTVPLCRPEGHCTVYYAKGPSCPRYFHLCNNGIHCLQNNFWCDGQTFADDPDSGCPDGSDEGTNCQQWDCLPNYWKCADNLKCLHAADVCDGRTSEGDYQFGCKDRSDEHNQLCGCPTENDWPCLDGVGCIAKNLVCDGYGNCNDGSDELPKICKIWNCSSELHKCANMKCINITNSGNDISDYRDSGQLCDRWSCAESWWACNDRTLCINENSVCDGKDDCYHKSDEGIEYCTEYTCLPGFTKCANNLQCIRITDICDGKYDCRDSSDELCDSFCLVTPLGGKKSIIRKCQKDPSVCVPVENYCDGVAQCPDASDEAGSTCTCEDWGMVSCREEGKMHCLNPVWIGTNVTSGLLYGRCFSFLTKMNHLSGKAKLDLESCIFVSVEGIDQPECLNYTSGTSCRTISYPANRGFSKICLQGNFNNISENIELLNKDGKLNGVAISSKELIILNCTFSISCPLGKPCDVSLIGITMIGCHMYLNNVHVIFFDVNLESVLITDCLSCALKCSNQIHFGNSTFYCSTDTTSCGLRLSKTEVGKIELVTSEFFNFVLYADVSQVVLIFSQTLFIQPVINIKVQSLEYLKIPAIMGFTDVTVISENQYLLHRSVFWGSKKNAGSLKLIQPSIILNLVNPYIKIMDSAFSGTHFEIHSAKQDYNSVFFPVSISNSTFQNAFHEGNGGLTITSEVYHSMLRLSSCIFSNNTAMKGFGDLEGKGGGLYVEANSLELLMEHCSFADNEASDSGLALYASEGVTLSLVNCSFQYELQPYGLTQHPLIFAAGRVTQFNGLIQIVNKKPDTNIGPISVFYIGRIQQINIEIQCPKFFKHVMDYSLRATTENVVPDLTYKCSPCIDNYFTTASANKILSFNGRHNTSLSGSLIKDRESERCIQCPFGGLCTGNNVIPRPNYWGYWSKDTLVFQQCPAGYCCAGRDNICSEFDHCEGDRTGVLCGACQMGFSVSILSGVCTPSSHCGRDQWFWLFVLLLVVAYVLWYTFKNDIFYFIFTVLSSIMKLLSQSTLSKNISAITEDQSKNKNILAMSQKPAELINFSKDAAFEENDTDGALDKGYFGIVTYYVQMAAVISIQIEFSDIDNSESFLDKMVNTVGQFLNLELKNISFDACPIVELTTLGRVLYSLCFLVGIYISWMAMFVSVIIMSKMFSKQGKFKLVVGKLQKLRINLIGGIVEIIKYTYVGFCGIIFMSLVCTRIGTRYVWWYDGTNTCMENWQVVVIVFAMVYAFPFPLILIFGVKLLKRQRISAATFLCCCLCPLVGLCAISIHNFLDNNANHQENTAPSKAASTIISILQGPYRDNEKGITPYWEGMISIRRLLITSMTLVGYASIRMIIITGLSLAFLVQHIKLNPFQIPSSNNVETLSLVLLCMTSVINLLKATLTDSGVVPSGPTVPFFKSLEVCEKIFVSLVIVYILVTELKLRNKARKQ